MVFPNHPLQPRHVPVPWAAGAYRPSLDMDLSFSAHLIRCKPPCMKTMGEPIGTRGQLLDGLRLNDAQHQAEMVYAMETLGFCTSRPMSIQRPRPKIAELGMDSLKIEPTALGFGDRAGPFLQDKLVFQTRKRVLSSAVCAAIRREARAKMDLGARSAFTMVDTNRDVPVHEMPRTLRWLMSALSARIFPAIVDCFPHVASHHSELYVYRALVIEYDAAAGLTHQPVHRDASLVSLIVPLNNASEYAGGGTFIESLERSFRLPEGHMLIHPSALRHAGARVTAGKRIVLVVFLCTRSLRWHEHGRCFKVRARKAAQKGDWQEELRQLQFALAVCPKDHELWYDQGACLHDAGRLLEAARCYERAIQLEPRDPQPYNNLGAIHLEFGSHRHAFTCFRKSLERDPYNEDAAMNAISLLASLGKPSAARRVLHALLGSLTECDGNLRELGRDLGYLS